MKMVVAAGILLIAGLSVAWPLPEPALSQAPAQDSLDSAALVEALQAVEGCLGVEQAMTRSGKGAIFAWFEDKDAVLEWYYSDAHQEAMAAFFPEDAASGHEPLSDVPDGTGPILCIASLTFDSGNKIPGVELPLRQISIELYTPLPGGASFGGTFAPAAMEIPGHVRETAPEGYGAK